MKIYNRRNFLSGIFLLFLGILLMVLNTLVRFKVKTLITSVLCLFFGIISVLRSMSQEMSKEDMIHEQDERNKYVSLKSRSKSFSMTQTISFILMLLSFILAKLRDSETFVYVGIGLLLSFIISIISEFCTSMYYERRI